MKKNEPSQIRNIAVIGHGKSGKTSLAEAMLFCGKSTDRLCKVDNGESVFDFEQEEKDRKITIMSALHNLTWKKHFINIIDTPGDANFVSDTFNSLQVVDAAILVVDAAAGVQVVTEKLWQRLREKKIPTMIVISRLDRENTDFYKALENIKEKLGINPTQLQLPIGSESGFKGVVDLLKMKAEEFASNDTGDSTTADIPADMQDKVSEIREKFIEDIAESSEELLDKYLDGQELSNEEISSAIKAAVADDNLYCVMCSAGTKNFGTKQILDFVINCFPSPLAKTEVEAIDPKTEEMVKVKTGENEPLFAYVFKTIADPYAGKLTLFRVFSGTVTPDSTLYNAKKQTKEKIGQILRIEGKAQNSVDSAVTGDIVAVAKLKETTTGDTFAEDKNAACYKEIEHQKPVASFAVFAKNRSDEDKMAGAFARLMEEDPTLIFGRNDETKEFLLSGVGQVHLDVAVSKLKRKFGVDIEMKTPKISYRETIKGRTKIQGKHKKQSGGRGQFADTWIEIQPLPGGGFEFENKIVGGAIPKNYIPAVEKGIVNQMKDGILAGYPIVDIKVSLYDGGYHDVDSSDMAFQIAGSKGFKLGFPECKPILLEPIMSVEVTVPDDATGDVMGDLNSRRGRVLGMEQAVGGQMVKAHVPLAEMLMYSAELTSMTSGRGMFEMEFDHYEEVPREVSEKIIAASKTDEE